MEGRAWELLSIVITGIFSGTGIISLVIARKERTAILKEKEALAELAKGNVLEKIQSLYRTMVEDYDKDKAKQNFKIAQLEQEVGMLQKIIEKQRNDCASCINKPQAQRRRKGNNHR